MKSTKEGRAENSPYGGDSPSKILKMFSENMEAFVSLDQFLTDTEIGLDQHLTTKATHLVNKDIGLPTLTIDEIEDKHLAELNFDNAWDLLNAMESESLDQITNSSSTIQTKSLGSLFNDQVTPVQSSDDLPTPILLNNLLDLPFDICTPDVDTTMLNADIPEFFACLENETSYSSSTKIIPTSTATKTTTKSQSIVQETAKQETTVRVQQSTDQISPCKLPILTLNIGQNNGNIIAGKGAKLQLKRQASNTQTHIPTVQVKTVQGESSDSVMTIVITLGNNERSDSTNSSIMDASADEGPPEKMSKHENKYDEMRKKNNEASRRSRRTRKTREQEMQIVAKKLEQENTILRAKVETLEKQIAQVKTELINIFQNKDIQS